MARGIQFGCGLLWYDEWSHLAERVGRYEALGLDTFRVHDRFVFPWKPDQPWLEVWSLLAARTGRIFLAGFSPGAEAPWAPVGGAGDIIGRYGELGFDELVIPEPHTGEWGTFERVIAEFVPRFAAASPSSSTPLAGSIGG